MQRYRPLERTKGGYRQAGTAKLELVAEDETRPAEPFITNAGYARKRNPRLCGGIIPAVLHATATA